MMLKRVIVSVAVASVLVVSGAVFAQVAGGPIDPGPIGEEFCCSGGIPSVPPGQKCILLHRVGEGENLHILSAYYYGDARAWGRIYCANKDVLRNPNKIYQGQILKIEVTPCWTPRYDFFEFMELERQRLEILKSASGKPKKIIKTVEEIEPTVTIITGPEIVEPGSDDRGPIIDTTGNNPTPGGGEGPGSSPPGEITIETSPEGE